MRLRNLRQLVLCGAFILLVGDKCQAAADDKADEHKASVSTAGKEKAKETEVKPKFRKGVYRGKVELFDKDNKFLVVTPLVSGRSATFYLDSRTLYRIGRRKGSFKDVKLGEKVAVRFFGKDYLFLADEICVVNGKFEKEHCKRPMAQRKKVEE